MSRSSEHSSNAKVFTNKKKNTIAVKPIMIRFAQNVKNTKIKKKLHTIEHDILAIEFVETFRVW